MDPAPERVAGIPLGRFPVVPARREVFSRRPPGQTGGAAGVRGDGARLAGPGHRRNSLAAQSAALRASFGAERELIRTVSGRGYQFTGEIRILSASPNKAGAGVATAEHVSVLPPTNAPNSVSELIGRDAEVEEVLRLASAHRLLTLTGAGGIGKTTLALALARELRPHFADGGGMAEVSALADPGLVPATVAAAVGLELGGGDFSARRVVEALA